MHPSRGPTLPLPHTFISQQHNRQASEHMRVHAHTTHTHVRWWDLSICGLWHVVVGVVRIAEVGILVWWRWLIRSWRCAGSRSRHVIAIHRPWRRHGHGWHLVWWGWRRWRIVVLVLLIMLIVLVLLVLLVLLDILCITPNKKCQRKENGCLVCRCKQ